MSENIERLYCELADYIHVKDDEGVRRIYRDLVQAGRSRSEVVGEVIRLGLVKHGTGEKIPGGGGLVGLARTDDVVEPNGAGQPRDPISDRAETPTNRERDFDLPDFQVTAEPALDQIELEHLNCQQTERAARFTISFKSTAARLCLVAGLVVAVASITGAVLLRPVGGKHSANAVDSANRPSMRIDGVASSGGPGEPGVSVTASQGASEAAASNTPPAKVSPPSEAVADGPSTPEPRAISVVTISNPAAPGDIARGAETPPNNVAISAAPTLGPSPAGTPATEPEGSGVSNPELLARGDALFGLGDLVSARLFYQRAAYGGDPKAAVQLGETYDPAFLARARLSGVSGDALLAVYWYQRARELGAPEAEILLRAMAPEKERSVP